MQVDGSLQRCLEIPGEQGYLDGWGRHHSAYTSVLKGNYFGWRLGKPGHCFCLKSEEAEITFTFREPIQKAHDKGPPNNIFICKMEEIIPVLGHRGNMGRKKVSPKVLHFSAGIFKATLTISFQQTKSN